MGLDRISAHDARKRIAVNDLVAIGFGQQFSFINNNAGWRAGAGVQKIWHDTRIILMPLVKNFRLLCSAFGLGLTPGFGPTGARHFVGIAKVAALHHIIDADAAVAIIVVVGLPHGAE